MPVLPDGLLLVSIASLQIAQLLSAPLAVLGLVLGLGVLWRWYRRPDR